eukprot:3197055-Alexandrium_andersonii.AAC.1
MRALGSRVAISAGKRFRTSARKSSSVKEQASSSSRWALIDNPGMNRTPTFSFSYAKPNGPGHKALFMQIEASNPSTTVSPEARKARAR